MKRVLITGASGLLGGALTERLLESDIEVWALRHKTEIAKDGVIEIGVDELAKPNVTKFDTLFHLGALITMGPDKSEALYHSNVALSDTLCKQVSFERIVHASTVSVYQQNGNTVKELSPISPQNPYAHSKYWGEHYIKQCQSFGILRFSSIFSSKTISGSFIYRAAKQAVMENRITLFGEGARLQNYINVNLAVDYLLSTANTESNLVGLGVSGRSYSNLEIAKTISGLTGCEIIHQGEDDSASFVYDNSETLRILGQKKNVVNLEKELSLLIKWLKLTTY
ncbi:MAG TPA: hypothetical protein DCR04_07240 [Flavobacteriales bacterium]|nr:hypothetical protein [Flavobacteriales bacterium]